MLATSLLGRVADRARPAQGWPTMPASRIAASLGDLFGARLEETLAGYLIMPNDMNPNLQDPANPVLMDIHKVVRSIGLRN